MRGRRDSQARPMIHRMAAEGWVVFSPSYRLSPSATFPDFVDDIRLAVAWIRRNADTLGVDPEFIAISGGSAGGQIAALVAFEAFDDAAVQMCVPLYGVHDLLDPTGTRPKWAYLVNDVMKTTPAQDPSGWRAASPMRS